jgi:hypothetical protein
VRLDHRALTLAVSAGAALLTIACSGGKNNKTANVSTNTAPAPIARTALPPTPAGISVTPVRTVSPSGAAGALPRTATPAAAAAGRTPTPVVVAGATRDAALQQQLEANVLTPSDLPGGFTQAGDPDRDLTDPSEVASYGVTYTSVGQSSSGVAIQAVYDSLTGFKDATTAQAQFQNVGNQFPATAGGDYQLQPVTNGPHIGDDTLSYQVSGQASGISVSGYAIVWRRGRIAAVLVQIGAPGIQSLDTTAALAQKQDAKMQSIH